MPLKKTRYPGIASTPDSAEMSEDKARRITAGIERVGKVVEELQKSGLYETSDGTIDAGKLNVPKSEKT